MKKAVIATGGKQYLVSEGEKLEIELLQSDDKTAIFTPLLVIDGDKSVVGAPEVAKASVTAEIIDSDTQGEKVTAIRYKAKKRVRKVRGHRQRHATIEITRIA